MEQTLILFLTFILIALIGLIGYLVYFSHRFLRLQESKKQEQEVENKELSLEELVKSGKLTPELAKIVKESEGKSNLEAKLCSDHPDTPAFKQCALSGEYLCANCITKQRDTWVAKKYMDLFLDSNWEEFIMLANTEENQDNIQEILDRKRELWSGDNVPLIVQGHYKINVENDNIESFTVVLIRPEDRDKIQQALSIFH